MNNTITLTIELGPQTQAKLDQILEALLNSKPNCHSCVQSAVAMTKDLADAANKALPEATAPQEAEEPVAPEITHPADVVSPHGDPEPVEEPEKVEPKPAAPKWTKADLQTKVQALAAPGTGKREKVREIVKSYAEKVGDIPADKYDEVMDKLIALEQEVQA